MRRCASRAGGCLSLLDVVMYEDARGLSNRCEQFAIKYPCLFQWFSFFFVADSSDILVPCGPPLCGAGIFKSPRQPFVKYWHLICFVAFFWPTSGPTCD